MSFFLSEKDREILNEVINDFRKRPKNTSEYETSENLIINHFYLTPVGGIAARTLASGVYTLNGADCKLMDCYMEDDGTIKAKVHDPEVTRMIYNSTNVLIKASDLIQTKRMGNFLFVDVGDC